VLTIQVASLMSR